ncbi:unnamed protein product [Symbiodinium natans]|uniref:Uncharacterized protein n=1 Tax=Symbiodinium natans TaxID=878477 RepID=A0A812JKK7_9DINO|nr:unnamed protein product [Symbiodinium natans]
MAHRQRTLLASLCAGLVLALAACDFSHYSDYSLWAEGAKVPDKAHHKSRSGGDHEDPKFVSYVKRGCRQLERVSKLLCGVCILACMKACSGLVATTSAATWSPGLLAILAYFVCQFVGPPGIVAAIVFFGAKAKAASVGAIAAKVAAANLAAVGALGCGLLSILFEMAAS